MGLEEIRKLKEGAGLPKQKKTYRIPKKSAKKLAQEKKEKDERGGEDTELQKFFKKAMKHMEGKCEECGARTETKKYEYAIRSICHILAKRKSVCPSVAYHPLNWIELCEDHHHKFDNSSWEDIGKWKSWELIRNRLIMIHPDIDASEMRHFPESVIKYMEENEPF